LPDVLASVSSSVLKKIAHHGLCLPTGRQVSFHQQYDLKLSFHCVHIFFSAGNPFPQVNIMERFRLSTGIVAHPISKKACNVKTAMF